MSMATLIAGEKTEKLITVARQNDSKSGIESDDGIPVRSYRMAPVVGTAQLGPDGFWEELSYPVGFGDGYLDVPTSDPSAYALRVKGDSMTPAIRDGWFVVVEPNEPYSPGEYVVVVTTDGRSMVKELLWERDDQVVLMSVADGYGRLTLDRSNIKHIHHVAFIAPPSKRKHYL
jgi:phage repressor protein C with HTH and peptisase S24 domain